MTSSSSAAMPEVSCYVPNFKEDIFISYGHLDNEVGWVTALHERLRVRIPEVLGQPIRIWRDKKLNGADALWETLEQKIRGSAVLISVLTPRYIISKSCADEVNYFRSSSGASGGLKVGNMVRMIRVIKTPYPRQDEPPQFAPEETLGFPFYKVDSQDDTCFQEFPATENLPGYTDFYSTSERLAQAAARLLKLMHDQRISGTEIKRAFLAYTSSDRKQDRDMVSNTLRSKGFEVLPTEPLPDTAAALLEQLNNCIKHSAVAVHILGSKAGTIMDDDPRPIIRLQYELVLMAGASLPLRQLLWIPEDLQDIDPRQQQLLDELKTVGDQRIEVLRTGRAAFIESVLDELQRKPSAKRSDQAKSVFLVYTREDLEQIGLKQIRNYLLSHGFPVEQPAFQGDPALLEELRNQNIAATDSALIYYGTAPDGWVEMMRLTLRKALATSDARNHYIRGLYLSVPADELKKNKYSELPSPELPECGVARPLIVVGDCGPFDPGKLKPFLDQLGANAP